MLNRRSSSRSGVPGTGSGPSGNRLTWLRPSTNTSADRRSWRSSTPVRCGPASRHPSPRWRPPGRTATASRRCRPLRPAPCRAAASSGVAPSSCSKGQQREVVPGVAAGGQVMTWGVAIFGRSPSRAPARAPPRGSPPWLIPRALADGAAPGAWTQYYLLGETTRDRRTPPAHEAQGRPGWSAPPGVDDGDDDARRRRRTLILPRPGLRSARSPPARWLDRRVPCAVRGQVDVVLGGDHALPQLLRRHVWTACRTSRATGHRRTRAGHRTQTVTRARGPTRGRPRQRSSLRCSRHRGTPRPPPPGQRGPDPARRGSRGPRRRRYPKPTVGRVRPQRIELVAHHLAALVASTASSELCGMGHLPRSTDVELLTPPQQR